MTSAYTLLIHSIAGVPLQPSGPLGRLKASSTLYVSIHQEGVQVPRTPNKSDFGTPWDSLYILSAKSESSKISFRLMRDPFLPRPDICLGTNDTDIVSLLAMCPPDDESIYARLEIKPKSRDSQTSDKIILSVRLVRQVDASEKAIDVAKVSSKRLESSLGSIIDKLDNLLRLGDAISKINPYFSIAWKVLTVVYQVAKRQKEADEKLLKLVDTMVDVYSVIRDTDFLADKLKSLEETALAIAKQTVECAYFIQEYTGCGFGGRTIRTLRSGMDKKIDGLIETLVNLKKSFEGRMVVHSLFMSIKILQKVEKLDQSDTLKKLNPVDMNANARTTCLAGTRGDILDTIRHWASIPGANSNSLFWLSGVAGSGKSTISTTVAETFRALERLGAFLFFDRNNQVQSHPNGVIRTLAYWLTQMNPHIAAAISDAIERDPAIVNAPIRSQFQSLLLEPLQSAESHIEGPILVVLDALDECGDPVSRAGLLFVLATEVPRLPKNFRFLITSREGKDITDQLQHISTRMQLDVSSTSPDISRFITHEMELIRNREGDDLPPTWPGTQSIQSLVELSGGLFIWASTATTFITEYDPEARLQTLLAHHFIPGSKLDDARAVLGCVVLGKVPMTDETMDAILFPGHRSAARVLKHLRCVVQWSGSGTEARTIHLSFADYLANVGRSGGEPWAIDAQMEHTTLALGCLRVLNSGLKFNICDLEDSHLLNTEVADLADRIGRQISPQLQYSSCFWLQHLEKAPVSGTLLNELTNMLYHNFLYWLEVLSLLGQVSRASEALRTTAHYTKGHSEDLEAFIADAIKFEIAFAPIITQSTPHIYLSALAFTPHQSVIATHLADQFPRKVTYSGPLGANWPTLQKVLRGHSDPVQSISFSSDGVHIVSGCSGGELLVWDTRTGECVLELKMQERSRIRGVRFTPDGSRVVSATKAGITVWNAITGQSLLEVPFEAIYNMDVSADGTRIAVGTTTGIIQVWDARAGQPVATWRTHQGLNYLDGEECIHFSPTSSRLASASTEYTASIWDSETGLLVVGPLQHRTPVSWIQFSQDASKVVTSSTGTVHIWNANTGEQISIWHYWTSRLTFSPDGACLANTTSRGTIEIRDTETGQDITGALKGLTPNVTALCFSPDGARLASTGGGTIHIWNAQSAMLGTAMNHTSIHGGAPICLDLSSDGTRFAYGTEDRMLIIRETETDVPLAGIGPEKDGIIRSVHFSPNGDLVAAVIERPFDSTVCVYSVQTLAKVAILKLPSHVGILQFSEDAPQVTIVSRMGSIYRDLHTDTVPQPIMIDLEGRFRFQRTQLFSETANGPFSHSGALVACAHSNENPCITIWDFQTGGLITEIKSVTVGDLHLSPDGMRLAGVESQMGSSHCVSIWDTRTGRRISETPWHQSISAVQFSPNGLYLAVGTEQSEIFVLNTETMHVLPGVLHGHTESVCSLRWMPNGTHIASLSWDKTIRFWDIRASFESNSALQAHLGDYPIFGMSGPEDGWVLNTASERMFWVPPWLRQGLYFPRNTLVIRDRGTTKLDLSQFVHGPEWAKCIESES
ncbi:hypothetical protein FB45DRAFT_1061819 [Roridomyces roridus]|uniref:Nephrocystin 3-like N-terminal domain-containing protein n=1 Tax=Roridomyces roridus TaxID=1738132 RepID=A0AAD7BIH8_9AGAR|nr:hypothetical protein FB45DRAFT_1061819 [Roridomyces roridus]